MSIQDVTLQLGSMDMTRRQIYDAISSNPAAQKVLKSVGRTIPVPDGVLDDMARFTVT